MKSPVLAALIVTAMAIPTLALGVPRPPEPRLHPRDAMSQPSYVRKVLPSIIGLKVRADEDAPSSIRLGAERFATGVIFDARGYALTVSYALLDARSVQAATQDNRVLPARVIGIDYETGLGVVKLPGEEWPAVTLGHSRDVKAGDVTGTVGVDEDNDLVYVNSSVHAVSRFSAFWEYMLDRALFVKPSSASWGGSAIVDVRGDVVGIASLRIGQAPHMNVAIPVEKFVAVKDELIAAGRVVSRRPRPWLGLYTAAVRSGVVVDGFAATGPARTAGFQKGDQIIGVNGVAIGSQEEFYEQLWRNQAGDVVRVSVRRDSGVHVIPVRSIERGERAERGGGRR